MGIGQAPLIGHSLGAMIALEYAVRHPDRVNKVMAVSLPIGEESINRNLVDFANNSMLAKMRWWRQITHPEVTKEVEKTNKEAITLSMRSLAEIDIAGRIQSLGEWNEAMLLMVYGEKDDIIDPDPVRSLDGHWNNIRPIGLADSKHFPMLEQTAKFNRLLREFLEIEGDLARLELKEEWRRRTR
jgi:pimeloyl-ACP methyl ester carboxylesterase